MKEMTAEQRAEITREIRKAVAKIEDMFGLEITCDNFVGHANGVAMRVSAVQVTQDGVPMGRAAHRFVTYAHLIGLDASHLGSLFTNDRGEQFQIIGYRPEGASSVIAKSVEDGRTACFRPGVVQLLLENN